MKIIFSPNLIKVIALVMVLPWATFATSVEPGGDQVWINKTGPYALKPGIKCPASPSGWGCDPMGSSYSTVTRTFERATPKNVTFLPVLFSDACEVQYHLVFNDDSGQKIEADGSVKCVELQTQRFNPENNYIDSAPEANLSSGNIVLNHRSNYDILGEVDSTLNSGTDSRYLLKIPPVAIYQGSDGDLHWSFEFMFHSTSRVEKVDYSPNRPATFDLRLHVPKFGLDREEYLALPVEPNQGSFAKFSEGPLAMTVALADQIKLANDCPPDSRKNLRFRQSCQIQSAYRVNWAESSAHLTGAIQPYGYAEDGYKAMGNKKIFSNHPIDVQLMKPVFKKTDILKFH